MSQGKQLVFENIARLQRQIPDEPWYPLAVGALITIGNQWSDNTRLAYHYGIRSWHDWAREWREPCSMPPRPEAVVAWLEWQATEKKYARSTIFLHLSGLAWCDKWSRSVPGQDGSSLLKHPLISAWKRGYSKKSRARTRDPAPPTIQEIRLLIQDGCLLAQPKRRVRHRGELIQARDRAWILLAFYGAMRKGELVDLRVGDVAMVPRGLELTFRKSKTDQEGKGEMRALYPQEEVMLCPVDAWHRWLAVYQPSSPDSPAFCATGRRGEKTDRPLAYQTVDAMLAARCRDAGIRRLYPHLLRAAFATQAAETCDEGDVAYHGRWRSRTTMDRYVRRSKTWKKNPTIGLSGKGI